MKINLPLIRSKLYICKRKEIRKIPLSQKALLIFLSVSCVILAQGHDNNVTVTRQSHCSGFRECALKVSRTSALKGNSILIPYTKPIPGSDEDVKGLAIQIHSNRELLIILRGCKERKAMNEQKISAMLALNAVQNRGDNQEKNAHPSVRKKSRFQRRKKQPLH